MIITLEDSTEHEIPEPPALSQLNRFEDNSVFHVNLMDISDLRRCRCSYCSSFQGRLMPINYVCETESDQGNLYISMHHPDDRDDRDDK